LRALSLFSGSLASRVATRLVERFSFVDEVFLLHFRSPFFECYDDIRKLVKQEWPTKSFRTQSLNRDYRYLIDIPPGAHFSLDRSCRNCRRLMLAYALRYMGRIKADFIVTGAVLGRGGLGEKELLDIEGKVGLHARVLRPLSARLLPSINPEVESKVGRAALYDIGIDDGQRLIELAGELGLSPADPLRGEKRCKLRIPGYGRRVESLFREQGITMNTLKLLEFPIFYKRPPDVKIVLAVAEHEKRALQNFFLPHDLRVYLPAHRGPMTLVRTAWGEKSLAQVEEIIEFASRITATYGEVGSPSWITVNYRFEKDEDTSQLSVLPFDSPEEISDLMRRTC